MPKSATNFAMSRLCHNNNNNNNNAQKTTKAVKSTSQKNIQKKETERERVCESEMKK